MACLGLLVALETPFKVFSLLYLGQIKVHVASHRSMTFSVLNISQKKDAYTVHGVCNHDNYKHDLYISGVPTITQILEQVLLKIR